MIDFNRPSSVKPVLHASRSAGNTILYHQVPGDIRTEIYARVRTVVYDCVYITTGFVVQNSIIDELTGGLIPTEIPTPP